MMAGCSAKRTVCMRLYATVFKVKGIASKFGVGLV